MKKSKTTAPGQVFPRPSLKSFELLEGLFADEVGSAFRKALKWLEKDPKGPDARGERLYRKFFKAVAARQEFARHALVGDGLRDHWLERLLENDNAFHRKAELVPYPQLGPALKDLYAGELGLFLKVLRHDWEKDFRSRPQKTGKAFPAFSGIRPLEVSKTPTPSAQARRDLKERLLKSPLSPAQLAPEIAAYFYENGFGPFGRYRAFRWDAGARALSGLEAVDPIRLENLVGYDEQRKPLLENIEAFVKGKPANNVLLYGERGTGKSSTVKALLNANQGKGLRLVEVPPAHLMDLPAILALLRGRPEKFVLFVDDLSFEENETAYRGLKAVLEGTLEASPKNVILIATSNRRHLVREFFADRAGGLAQEGEIHGADTVEEKLSLADRFGLVVSFYAPDQQTFLRMVEEWARVEGIRLGEAELHLRALQWARFNNGRSGRTARQFINDLKGKMG